MWNVLPLFVIFEFGTLSCGVYVCVVCVSVCSVIHFQHELPKLGFSISLEEKHRLAEKHSW